MHKVLSAILLSATLFTVPSSAIADEAEGPRKVVCLKPDGRIFVRSHCRKQELKLDAASLVEITSVATTKSAQKGEPGPKGDTGAAGPQGPQGPSGADGAPGLKGDAGAAGLQGVAGPQGPEGPQGPAGAQGLQGLVGPAGSPGLTGVEIVQQSGSSQGDNDRSVYCPSGKKIIGGGANLDLARNSSAANSPIKLTASFPDGPMYSYGTYDRWTASVRGSSPYGVQLYVYAICADIQ